MRRLLLVMTLGLFALPVAACANDSNPNAGATTPAVTTAANASNTEEVCKDIETIFDDSTFQDLGGAIGSEVMTLTVGTDGAGLTFEVLMRPEIRAPADKELPPGRSAGLLPGDQDECIITGGGVSGLRGFFTRDERGAVVGVDLAGRLFTWVATASQPSPRSSTGDQEVRP